MYHRPGKIIVYPGKIKSPFLVLSSQWHLGKTYILYADEAGHWHCVSYNHWYCIEQNIFRQYSCVIINLPVIAAYFQHDFRIVFCYAIDSFYYLPIHHEAEASWIPSCAGQRKEFRSPIRLISTSVLLASSFLDEQATKLKTIVKTNTSKKNNNRYFCQKNHQLKSVPR